MTDRDDIASRVDVRNIMRVYRRATAEEVAEGIRWYQAAHTFAIGLSRRYGIERPQACGIIAALSPQVAWARNMTAADELCRTGRATGVLGASVAKAQRILAGEPVSQVLACPRCERSGYSNSHVCTGQKVRNFYACILNPDTSSSVCVDRHAFDVAVGMVTDETLRKVLDRKGVYELVAEAYREAARRLDVPACQVQAVTWVAWRNRI